MLRLSSSCLIVSTAPPGHPLLNSEQDVNEPYSSISKVTESSHISNSVELNCSLDVSHCIIPSSPLISMTLSLTTPIINSTKNECQRAIRLHPNDVYVAQPQSKPNVLSFPFLVSCEKALALAMAHRIWYADFQNCP